MFKNRYPYFDFLLSQFDNQHSPVETSFGRHVHWGYWNNPALATVSDEDYAVAAENLTKQICTISDIQNNQLILDVGCGFGGTVAYINETHQGMDLVGINIDERQILRADTLVHAMPGNDVTFIQADACDLPFEENQFDRVLAVESIFHFPSRERFIKQAHRVLKTGGSITFSDFIPSVLLLPAARLLSTRAFENYSIFGACDISFTLNRYRRLSAMHGFELQVNDITVHTLPTYDYLKALISTLPRNLKMKSVAKATISLIKLISQCGLLRYQILNMRKSG